MTNWIDVCALDDLVPESGAPALLGNVQVALFRLADDSVFAVSQRDPFSGANVLSRGIVGTVGDVATLTSPMYKQVWALETGECLDPVGKDPMNLTTYAVKITDGKVWVEATDVGATN